MAITPTGKNAGGTVMPDVLQRILDGVDRTEEAPRGLVAEFARVRGLQEPSNWSVRTALDYRKPPMHLTRFRGRVVEAGGARLLFLANQIIDQTTPRAIYAVNRQAMIAIPAWCGAVSTLSTIGFLAWRWAHSRSFG